MLLRSFPAIHLLIPRIALPVTAALLTACAASPRPMPDPPLPQGAVGASLIEPAGDTRRMAPARNRRFIYPNLETSALPAYPPGLLALRLAPVVICVDIVIDATGTVAAAVTRSDGACAPLAGIDTAAFSAAALQAVRSWIYAPALLCEAPQDFDGDDACQADGVVEAPIAVRLSYAFRFSQQDGMPRVERMGDGG